MILIYTKFIVELTGVEPVSKQGSNMLSTCLSSPEIFVYRQDRSHQPIPYLLKLRGRLAARRPLSPIFPTPLYQTASENGIWEMSRYSTCAVIKLKVLYFRLSSESVIIFASYSSSCVFIVLPNNALHAYIPLLLAVKTKQPQLLVINQLECKGNKNLQNCPITI